MEPQAPQPRRRLGYWLGGLACGLLVLVWLHTIEWRYAHSGTRGIISLCSGEVTLDWFPAPRFGYGWSMGSGYSGQSLSHQYGIRWPRIGNYPRIWTCSMPLWLPLVTIATIMGYCSWRRRRQVPGGLCRYCLSPDVIAVGQACGRCRKILRALRLAMSLALLCAAYAFGPMLRVVSVPVGLLLVIWFFLLAWFTIIPAMLAWRWSGRTLPGFCATCGYNLTGNVSGRCPECGSLTPEAPGAKATPREPAGREAPVARQ